jgi:hypothetical protein
MAKKLITLYLYYTVVIILLPTLLVLVSDITNWYHFSLVSYAGGVIISIILDFIQSVIKRIIEHDNK